MIYLVDGGMAVVAGVKRRVACRKVCHDACHARLIRWGVFEAVGRAQPPEVVEAQGRLDQSAIHVSEIACSSRHGSQIWLPDISDLGALGDYRGAIVERKGLAADDPDAGGRIATLTDEVSVACPGPQNEIGESGAAVFRTPTVPSASVPSG